MDIVKQRCRAWKREGQVLMNLRSYGDAILSCEAVQATNAEANRLAGVEAEEASRVESPLA